MIGILTFEWMNAEIFICEAVSEEDDGVTWEFNQMLSNEMCVYATMLLLNE